jgi:prophage antirepressor-like protein
MSNEVSVFNFENYDVRIVDQNGEPWWVLKDVCDVLGIENSRNVSARLDDDEKGVHPIDTPGGSQEMTTINESGLYSTILRSESPETKRFKKWVTSEVLPSIRKTGKYSYPRYSYPRKQQTNNHVQFRYGEFRKALEKQYNIKNDAIVKTTGLDILEAVKLANGFCCDLYSRKSQKLYKYKDIANTVFSYKELVFSEWELKNFKIYNFYEAVTELMSNNPSIVYGFYGDDFVGIEMCDGALHFRTGDIVKISKEIVKTNYLIFNLL